LKWEDFDEQNSTLKIRHSIAANKNGKIPIGETKTGTSSREILLPQSTAELLRRRKGNSISDWIFPKFHNPDSPINPLSAYTKNHINYRQI